MWCGPYTPSCMKLNVYNRIFHHSLCSHSLDILLPLKLGKVSIESNRGCDSKNINSLPKFKNQGRKHQKLAWMCFLKIYATNLSCDRHDQIRVRRRSWCLWKEHKKLYKTYCLFVEMSKIYKKIPSFVSLTFDVI